MGQIWTMCCDRFGSALEERMLMIGLDGAGKTTALYQLKLGMLVSGVPTVGFNVDMIAYKRLRLTVWDMGGQSRVRSLWRYYCCNTIGVLFVVDAADFGRLSEARYELHGLMNFKELSHCVLMVFANKQDLRGAATTEELAQALNLVALRQTWQIHGVSAHTRDGLAEGMEKLYRMIRLQQRLTLSNPTL